MTTTPGLRRNTEDRAECVPAREQINSSQTKANARCRMFPTEPPASSQVIRSETEFALVFYRTQLFGVGDIEEVKKVQSG